MQNDNFSNNSDNKITFKSNNDNLNDPKSKFIENNSCLNLFNICLNKEGETSLSLVKIIGNQTFLQQISSEQIIHKVPFINKDRFPCLCSRLININNKAFIIGGIPYLEENDCGNKFVFRLDYFNKEIREPNIYIVSMKETIFPHQSHHLIYSELYNFIFVISGKGQKKCEYGILDKEKKEIKEWKEIDSVNVSKENAICFLLNEKYIFLFGGINNNYQSYKYDYEVFNISLISKNKSEKWKTHQFITNKNNKAIFHIKIAGIIETNNNIYILGGFNYGLGPNLNYIISFNEEKNGGGENGKIIESINNCESLNKYKDILSFYGQQKFMEYQEKFHNINILGKYTKLSKYELDNKIKIKLSYSEK